jgi:hypothetical protein
MEDAASKKKFDDALRLSDDVGELVSRSAKLRAELEEARKSEEKRKKSAEKQQLRRERERASRRSSASEQVVAFIVPETQMGDLETERVPETDDLA